MLGSMVRLFFEPSFLLTSGSFVNIVFIKGFPCVRAVAEFSSMLLAGKSFIFVGVRFTIS